MSPWASGNDGPQGMNQREGVIDFKNIFTKFHQNFIFQRKFFFLIFINYI